MSYKEEEEEIKNERNFISQNINKEDDIDMLDAIRNYIIDFNENYEEELQEENQLFSLISSLLELLSMNQISDDIISLFNDIFITNLINLFTQSQNENFKPIYFNMISYLIQLKNKYINDIFVKLSITDIISSLFSTNIIDFNKCSTLLSSLSLTNLKARNESMKIIPILTLNSVLEGENEEEILNAFNLILYFVSHQVSFDMAIDVFCLIRTSLECQSLSIYQILLIIESISRNQMKTFDLLKSEGLDCLIYDNLNNIDDNCCEIACNVLINTIKNDDILFEDLQKIISFFSSSSPPYFIDTIVTILTKKFQDLSMINSLIDIGCLDVLCVCSSIGCFTTKNNIILCISNLIGNLLNENPSLLEKLLTDNIISVFEPGLESLDLEIQIQTLISLQRLLNFAMTKEQSFQDVFIKSLFDLDLVELIEEIDSEDQILNELCIQFLNVVSEIQS